jgi:iron complex outermembrane receptor protein
MVNIPIGSMLSFRFAGFSEVHDPYYQNAGPLYDHTAAENADAYALRAQMLYQPTQRFSALVGYDLTAERGTGYLGANFQGALTAVDASNPLAPVGIPFDISKVDNPRRVYYTGMHPSVGLKHQGIRGELNFDSGPAIFQAIASYRWLRYQQVTGANAGAVTPGYDYANVNPDVFTNTLWDSRSQSLIAELRAFAPDSARLRWSAGAFYFNEDQQVFSSQVSDPAGNYAGAEFNMPDVKGGSVAAYADATFDVVQSFRVIGGVRLTHESKSRKNGLWAIYQGFPSNTPSRFGTEGYQPEGLSRSTYDLPKNPDGSYDASITNRVNLFLDGVKSFGARDTLPQALCNDPIAAAPGQQQTPRVIPNPTGSGMRCSNGVRQDLNPNIVESVPQNNSDTDTYLDWRAGLEYDLAKDSLLYFTATTGHKAGGFNDTAPGAAPGELYNSTYKPESVLAFELGSKNQLLGRRLRLNGSAFAYAYKDMVFQTIAAVGDVGTPGMPATENDNQAAPNTAVRQNAKNSTPIYGFDLDAIYALPAGLEAEAHLLLMDAKFKDGTIARDTRISDVPAENYDVDLGGHWLPRVSPYTFNYTLSQLIFTTAGTFNWVIQGQTRGKQYMSVYNGEGKLLPPANGEMPNSVTYQRLQLPGFAQRLTDVVPTYTRFDVGVGWKHPDGRISINGFVNNVTNIAYSTSIISTTGLNLRFFNPPRTAGVRFRVDW